MEKFINNISLSSFAGALSPSAMEGYPCLSGRQALTSLGEISLASA